MDLRRGGKAAIDRMIEAYGFTTKQSLCEQLGISSSTLANRYLRDTFPADYVIQCSLETGVSLRWLVFGEGEKMHYLKVQLFLFQLLGQKMVKYFQMGSLRSTKEQSLTTHLFLWLIATSQ